MHRPNSKTNLVMVLRALCLLFCNSIKATAYHLGRYKPLSPSTEELDVNGIPSLKLLVLIGSNNKATDYRIREKFATIRFEILL